MEVPDDVPSMRDVPPSLHMAGSMVAGLCRAVGAGSAPPERLSVLLLQGSP